MTDKLELKRGLDRAAHRAAVEAGYASLADYVALWGGDDNAAPAPPRRFTALEARILSGFIEFAEHAGIDWTDPDDAERAREMLPALKAELDAAREGR
jgi:hypothetical protein